MRKIYVVILALFLTSPAFSHGGGLDGNGCHNDRKRGGYHCHGSRKAPSLLSSPAKRKRVVAKAKKGIAKAQSLFGKADAYYANCSQARAAGAAPVRYGSPGYSRRLDRDGDGIGCE